MQLPWLDFHTSWEDERKEGSVKEEAQIWTLYTVSQACGAAACEKLDIGDCLSPEEVWHASVIQATELHRTVAVQAKGQSWSTQDVRCSIPGGLQELW